MADGAGRVPEAHDHHAGGRDRLERVCQRRVEHTHHPCSRRRAAREHDGVGLDWRLPAIFSWYRPLPPVTCADLDAGAYHVTEACRESADEILCPTAKRCQSPEWRPHGLAATARLLPAAGDHRADQAAVVGLELSTSSESRRAARAHGRCRQTPRHHGIHEHVGGLDADAARGERVDGLVSVWPRAREWLHRQAKLGRPRQQAAADEAHGPAGQRKQSPAAEDEPRSGRGRRSAATAASSPRSLTSASVAGALSRKPLGPHSHRNPSTFSVRMWPPGRGARSSTETSIPCAAAPCARSA